MTREEWYKHKVLDAIELLDEYVDLMRDGAADTELSAEEIDSFFHGLCLLTRDISVWFSRRDDE